MGGLVDRKSPPNVSFVEFFLVCTCTAQLSLDARSWRADVSSQDFAHFDKYPRFPHNFERRGLGAHGVLGGATFGPSLGGRRVEDLMFRRPATFCSRASFFLLDFR